MYVRRYPFVSAVKPNFSIFTIANIEWNTPTGIATNSLRTSRYETSGIARRDKMAFTLSTLPE